MRWKCITSSANFNRSRSLVHTQFHPDKTSSLTLHNYIAHELDQKKKVAEIFERFPLSSFLFYKRTNYSINHHGSGVHDETPEFPNKQRTNGGDCQALSVCTHTAIPIAFRAPSRRRTLSSVQAMIQIQLQLQPLATTYKVHSDHKLRGTWCTTHSTGPAGTEQNGHRKEAADVVEQVGVEAHTYIPR